MRLRGNRVKKGEGCGVVDCWLDKIEIFSALYGSLRYYEKQAFFTQKTKFPYYIRYIIYHQYIKQFLIQETNLTFISIHALLTEIWLKTYPKSRFLNLHPQNASSTVRTSLERVDGPT